MMMPFASLSVIEPARTDESFGSYRIPIDTDRVRCTRQSMLAASAAGLNRQAGWAVATAVAELVGNVMKFARFGVLELRIVEGSRRGLKVVVDDDGPGIANIELALVDGYSEGRFIAENPGPLPRRGLGAGLGAVRRLMDDMEIDSVLECGTRVTAHKWCR